MKRITWGIVVSMLATGAADAALLSRAGGQAYYDTVLDITWVANANLGGRGTWDQAQTLIGALNSMNYLGASNWRLPTIVDTGAPGCDWAYSGTDCGFNVQTGSAATTVYSELASLYYDTLGNAGVIGTSGVVSNVPPGRNTGPFSGVQPATYWSGASYAPDPSHAWYFVPGTGAQVFYNKVNGAYVWPVSPGDALVPLPAVAWLVAGAFVGIGAAAKRRPGTGTAQVHWRSVTK